MASRFIRKNLSHVMFTQHSVLTLDPSETEPADHTDRIHLGSLLMNRLPSPASAAVVRRPLVTWVKIKSEPGDTEAGSHTFKMGSDK